MASPPTMYSRVAPSDNAPYQMSDPSRRVSQHSLPPMEDYNNSPYAQHEFASSSSRLSYPPTMDSNPPIAHPRVHHSARSFLDRLSGKGRVIPGVSESIVRLTTSSCLLSLFFYLPSPHLTLSSRAKRVLRLCPSLLGVAFPQMGISANVRMSVIVNNSLQFQC